MRLGDWSVRLRRRQRSQLPLPTVDLPTLPSPAAAVLPAVDPPPRPLSVQDLDRAAVVLREHSVRPGSPWDEFRDRFVALPDWYDCGLDPYSSAYAVQQDRLWQWLSGRPRYQPSEHEQTPETATQEHIYRPAFYELRGQRAMETGGKHIMAAGHFLRRSGISSGDRVLEYGAGYGQTALTFARMGARVDTVDINPHFSRAVQAQAEFFKVELQAFVGEFGDHPRPGEKYRLIFFYEAFHHSRDFLGLIRRLRQLLADDGRILLGGEPVTEDPRSPAIPYPWGLRLDAETAGVVRWRGWYELGFQEDFLARCFIREGFEYRKHACEAADFAVLYEFRPRPPVLALESATLAPSDAATWHGAEGGGRWTTARSTLTLDVRGAERRLGLTAINHHPTPMTVSFTVGSVCHHQLFGPRERLELNLSAPDGDRLLIECEPQSPASYGSPDTRLLGLFVEQVVQPEPVVVVAEASIPNCLPVGTVPPPPPDVAPWLRAARRHAPGLVQAAYRGLLQREADAGSLERQVGRLREGGSLEDLLQDLVQGPEFGQLAERQRRSRFAAAELPAPPLRLALLGKCQAVGVGRCLQALTGWQPPRCDFVTAAELADPSVLLRRFQSVLADHDQVLLQSNVARALAGVTELPAGRVLVFPTIVFPAFHPDLCQVSGPQGPVRAPLSFSSSISFHAWKAGMSPAQAVSLFNREVYTQLGFFSAWEPAVAALLEPSQPSDLDLTGLPEQWRRQGAFMHSPNHPKLRVLANLARRLLQRLGLPALDIDPAEALWDPLADHQTYPVYPEIAAQLGLSGGSHLFKAAGLGAESAAGVRWLDLEEFVQRSFAAFAAQGSPESLRCSRPREHGYRDVFGAGRQTGVGWTGAAPDWQAEVRAGHSLVCEEEQLAEAAPEPVSTAPVIAEPPSASSPSVPAGYAELLQRHAPTLIQAAYQGLLNREADVGGLAHHVDNLRREGRVESTLQRILGSDEFLTAFEERSQFHSRAIQHSLPPPKKRIAIYTNCQGNNLGRCIQALSGTQPPTFRFVTAEDILRPERALEAVRTSLAENDVVLMQPIYAEAMRAVLPELDEKLVLFPSISFPAFQPDQCYVRIKGTLNEVSGPLGPYHSSIAYYAWRAGMSQSQAADLFCDPVYEQLRFHDYWDSATEALLDEGRRCGMALDGLFKQWRARGCFMHSPNHPKLFAVADIARQVMQKLGLEMLPIDPLEVVWDNLADTSIWPVYPEIARRIGIEGSYIFKGNNPGLPSKSPIVSYDLEAFIARSFEAFEQYSRSHEIACNRAYTARYQAVFGRSGAVAVEPVRAPTPAPTRAHPYSGLPARRFWKSAIQQTPAGEVDPVGDAAFLIRRDSRVATAGSCFAQHISQRLRRQGFLHLQTELPPEGLAPEQARRQQYGVYSARYGNLYTARQLRQLFERAYGQFVPREPPWQRPDGRLADPFRPEIEPGGFADAAALHASRAAHLAAVREMFERVEVFVFTLGLTEAWRSRADGAVFPLAPGVAAGDMDPARHEWVNFSVDEVIADLDAFVAALALRNPAAQVLFTVSPVPLAATYDDSHALTATTYSKSVLRVAAAEIVRRHPHCAYFPSYEIVTGHYNRGAYYDSDLRSVNSAGVDHVMRLFFAHYAPGGQATEPDPELLEEARDNYRVVCEEELLAGGRR
ncbi:MAG: GSCFA domain-containing protein [Stagnimonas sp.]|nr:GSCFA domain-containing protein [Stagnimonas sp.]